MTEDFVVFASVLAAQPDAICTHNRMAEDFVCRFRECTRYIHNRGLPINRSVVFRVVFAFVVLQYFSTGRNGVRQTAAEGFFFGRTWR